MSKTKNSNCQPTWGFIPRSKRLRATPSRLERTKRVERESWRSQKEVEGGAGFTFIELMVVVGIFMIIFFVSYQGLINNRQLEQFRLTTEQVASDIRKVQTMTLAGISAQDLGNISYGVYFNEAAAAQYLIFKNNNDSKDYEAGEDEIIQTITFPEAISLAGLGPDSPDPINYLTILFSPPKPIMYINGSEALNDVIITLSRDNLPDKQGVVNVKRITGRITAELINI